MTMVVADDNSGDSDGDDNLRSAKILIETTFSAT